MMERCKRIEGVGGTAKGCSLGGMGPHRAQKNLKLRSIPLGGSEKHVQTHLEEGSRHLKCLQRTEHYPKALPTWKNIFLWLDIAVTVVSLTAKSPKLTSLAKAV